MILADSGDAATLDAMVRQTRCVHTPLGRNTAIAGSHVTAQPRLTLACTLPPMPVCCVTISVVISTVGPFTKYGTNLVAACAATGTSYVDTTGETPWVRKMLEQHDATARSTGALMVPMCGFDSIPSDLGTYYVRVLCCATLCWPRPCAY